MEKIRYKSRMDPIPVEKFFDLTGLDFKKFGFSKWQDVVQIVAPTDLKKIIAVNLMPIPYLRQLLSKIGTLGDPDNKVYADAEINLECIDPNILYLGQKFVYRRNYAAILENFQHLFTGFASPRGITKMTAYLIIGIIEQDENVQYVLAHYIPPIIEIHENRLVLLDGVHHSFIAARSGANLESIVIGGVKIPFPCTAKPWSEIKVVDEKPPNIEDRYFDLKKELFRDLKGIGIDG